MLKKSNLLNVILFLFFNMIYCTVCFGCDPVCPSIYAAILAPKKYVWGLINLYNYDIDKINGHGRRPAHYAIFCVKNEALDALIEHGADLSLLDSSGRTPLEYAKERVLLPYTPEYADRLNGMIETLEVTQAKQAGRYLGITAGAYAGTGASVYTEPVVSKPVDIWTAMSEFNFLRRRKQVNVASPAQVVNSQVVKSSAWCCCRRRKSK